MQSSLKKACLFVGIHAAGTNGIALKRSVVQQLPSADDLEGFFSDPSDANAQSSGTAESASDDLWNILGITATGAESGAEAGELDLLKLCTPAEAEAVDVNKIDFFQADLEKLLDQASQAAPTAPVAVASAAGCSEGSLVDITNTSESEIAELERLAFQKANTFICAATKYDNLNGGVVRLADFGDWMATTKLQRLSSRDQSRTEKYDSKRV